MGWHASTAWDLRFINDEARIAAFADENIRSLWDIGDTDEIDGFADKLVTECGEEGEANTYEWVDGQPVGSNPLIISGWTGGKCYWDEEKASALAPYVVGTVEVDSGDDDTYTRDRFFGDGRAEQYIAERTFPGDPEDKRKVWTCAITDDDRPDVVPLTVSVHLTEEACWEWLRDNYDVEGFADDEPPVAIVEFLERDGYTINIDVHEI